jgi:hypothetical protein
VYGKEAWWLDRVAVYRTYLAKDRDWLRAVVSTVMNLPVP